MRTWIRSHTPLFAYGIKFFSTLNLSLPIWALFFTGYINLSLTEASLVYTVGMVTSIIFELPSGTRADRWGRKKVLLYGALLQLFVWIGYCFVETLRGFIVIELISGLAGALISGCLLSLVYDWYQEFDNTDLFPKFVRTQQVILFLSRSLASIIGGRLFVQYALYPYIGLVVMRSLVVFLILCLYEPIRVHTVSEYSFLGYIYEGWSQLRHDKIVFRFILYFIVSGAVMEMLRATYQPILQERGIPVFSIGIFYTIASLLSAFGSYTTKWFYKKENFDQMFLVKIGLQLLIGIFLLTLPGYWRLIPLILIQIVFGWYRPIVNDLINSNIPSSHRATVNSLMSLSNSLLRLVFGGISGFIFETAGLETISRIIVIWTIVFFLSYVYGGVKNKI